MAITFNLAPQRIAQATSGGWWNNQTIVGCLDRWAAEQPEAVALVAYSTTRGSRTELTYRQLHHLSLRVSLGLRALGLRAGDVLSFQLPNWWEALPLFLGAVRLGLVCNPIPPILRHREVEMILARVQPRALAIPAIFRGFNHRQMIEDLVPRLPMENLIVVGGDALDAQSYERLIETPWEEAGIAEDIRSPQLDPNGPLQVMFTSGTTGEPKGAIHTHNTLAAAWRPFHDLLGLQQQDTALVVSTICHQSGFLIGLHMPVFTGRKVVYLDIWNPDVAVPIIASEHVTWMHAGSPFLIGLVDSPALRPHDISDFRLVVNSGSAIPPALVQKTHRLGIKVIGLWGMTENGATTVVPIDDPDWRSLTSDGRAVPGSAVRVVDPVTWAPVPPGTTGLLCSRGPSHFVGYLNRPELFAAAHDQDGWFNTGDLACMTDDGYIRVVGRLKDIIIRGGENLPVIEIENAIYSNPKVREVAVVAAPDARLGERACAYVICRDGEQLTLAELQAHLAAAGMTKQYWPERLEIVSDFPRTPAGKIQKNVLRADIARKLGVGAA
jgi:cyclohexanecarboxylate-CoA ligase